jgi:hypothetical protein
VPLLIATANFCEPFRYVDQLAIGARRLIAEAQLVVRQRLVPSELALQQTVEAT